MFFPDDEKDEKESALERLKDMMRSEMGDRMGGKFKKPVAASMTIEKVSPDDMKGKLDGLDDGDDESMEDDNSDDEGGEMSDEDKDKIRELYHKFCV